MKKRKVIILGFGGTIAMVPDNEGVIRKDCPCEFVLANLINQFASNFSLYYNILKPLTALFLHTDGESKTQSKRNMVETRCRDF